MNKDEAISQIGMIYMEFSRKIETIGRMKTNKDHKEILVAEARKRMAALDIALEELKNGKI